MNLRINSQRQLISGKQRVIYTGPKGGKYYMKGGQKHYMKGGLNVGNQCEETSALLGNQCCHKRTRQIREGQQKMSYRWCEDDGNDDYAAYLMLKRDFNRIELNKSPVFLKTIPQLKLFLNQAIKHERSNANIITSIRFELLKKESKYERMK